jgi:hypothetical protein
MPYSAEEMPKVLQQIAAIGREFSDLITGESTEGRTVL